MWTRRVMRMVRQRMQLRLIRLNARPRGVESSPIRRDGGDIAGANVGVELFARIMARMLILMQLLPQGVPLARAGGRHNERRDADRAGQYGDDDFTHGRSSSTLERSVTQLSPARQRKAKTRQAIA
jgi:hypothetical protein